MAAPNRSKPNVLVLCDDDLLHEVIALSLRDCALQQAPLSPPGHPSPAGEGREGTNGYDLIVLALGASPAEPLVALARASLLEQVGVTPLLVVSRRPFEADAQNGIYHLPFPFDAAELGRQVRRLAL